MLPPPRFGSGGAPTAPTAAAAACERGRELRCVPPCEPAPSLAADFPLFCCAALGLLLLRAASAAAAPTTPLPCCCPRHVAPLHLLMHILPTPPRPLPSLTTTTALCTHQGEGYPPPACLPTAHSPSTACIFTGHWVPQTACSLIVFDFSGVGARHQLPPFVCYSTAADLVHSLPSHGAAGCKRHNCIQGFTM